VVIVLRARRPRRIFLRIESVVAVHTKGVGSALLAFR